MVEFCGTPIKARPHTILEKREGGPNQINCLDHHTFGPHAFFWSPLYQVVSLVIQINKMYASPFYVRLFGATGKVITEYIKFMLQEECYLLYI